MRLTRRSVLAAAAAAVARPAWASPPEPLPIVDTHQHLWDLRRFRLPWVKGSPLLNRDFLPADYLEAVRGKNVVQAVYMEVAMDPAQHDAEADYVVDLCRRRVGLTRAAVIGGRPAWEGFADYVRRFQGSPYVKGVRHIVRGTPGDKQLPVDDRFLASLRLLGRLGLRFDLCIPANMLADGAKVARACPDTQFVLDHCGNADPAALAPAGRKYSRPAAHDPDVWRRGIEAVAGCKNVVCKISGIVSRVEQDHWAPDDLAPIINHCLDSFGPDRVMFAGDWPVCLRGAPLGQWIDALKAVVATRPPAEQRRLFHDNAVAFYELSTTGPQ